MCDSDYKSLDHSIHYGEDADSMYEDQMLHFFSYCANKSSPICNVNDGIQVLKFIEDVEASAS